MLHLRDLALAPRRCPLCGPSLLIRLRNDELGVRCARCGASVVHWSLALSVRKYLPSLAALRVCELSSRGAWADCLRREARNVALSEYADGVVGGIERHGVRHEDVQRLSYADASFDLVTHTEVLEHVADDARALAELRRVLRPAGLMFFSVPLHEGSTLERARLGHAGIEHFLAPVYHGDPWREGAGILAYRDYGTDIVQRLYDAGFSEAWIERTPLSAVAWFKRDIVCARA